MLDVHVWRERLKKINKVAEEVDVDLLLIFGTVWRPENIRYLCDYPFRGAFALVLLDNRGETSLFLSDPLDLRRAYKEANAHAIEMVAPRLENVLARLRRYGDRGVRVGVVGLELMPLALVQEIQEAVPWPLADVTDAVERLRLVKDNVEIERIRRAAKLADEAYSVFLESVASGKREFEIVADVESAIRARGATDNFMLIAAGGAEVRGMTPPRNYAPRRGDLVRTELTPQLEGYWCQICRTCVVGPASDVQKEAFQLFLEAEEAGLKAARPGATVDQVARAENDVFRRAGYGEYVSKQYTRVRGHGHGLHFDEAPTVDEGVSLVLEPGMVLVIHPNTYHPGAGYVVIGDPVLITEEGAEIITTTPRVLFEV